MSRYLTVPYTRELLSAARDFDCGNLAISSFLRSDDAFLEMVGKTFVMLLDKKVIGYYNISTGHIEDGNEYRVGGSVYINFFAVDQSVQKHKVSNADADTQNISDLLLSDCLNRICDLRSSHIGFAFITLSSTQEGYHLYERNGFFPLEDDMKIAKNQGEKTCAPMYFPIDYE